MKLEKFLNPKSVAIIGASNHKEKLGFQILDNLKKGGYKGKIYPINLKEKKVTGLKAYQDIKELKNKVDLAVLVIPAKFVLAEIKKCAVSGMKNIIIISAGFSETGEEGKRIEGEIKRIGQKNKLNILGPNCLGAINSNQKINTTFASANMKKGNVAFISQSGAVGSAVLDWIQDKEFGLSYFISLGNKAVLEENDFFDFFAKDKNTELVIAYLEEIENGQEFMKVVSKLSKIKPVAILKSGKSEAGKQAAMSHTGSLAGSSKAVETGFRRSGVIELNSMEEAFNLMKIAQRKVESINKDIFIISNAGGPLVMTVDQFGKFDFPIGKYSDETSKSLAKIIPEIHSSNNPLDIIGDAPASRYGKAIKTVLADKKVNNLLVLLTAQTSTEVEKTAQIISRYGKKYKDKMVCASFIGGQAVKEAKNILNKNNIPNFDYPEQAVEAMVQFLGKKFDNKNLLKYEYNRKEEVVVTPYQIKNNKKQEQLDYLESFKLLTKYKIPISKIIKIQLEKDLDRIKYPIVMKVVGKNLIHKTDKNSIRLNLKNKKEAKKALTSFGTLLKNKDNYCIAQTMSRGFEIILGFKRDQSFGPIIMVGMGGIYAEILQDIQLEVDDLNYNRAIEMIKKLKSYKILAGARGQKPYAIESLADVIVKIAKLARENEDIKELDINPLFITNKGVKAVDVRIIK